MAELTHDQRAAVESRGVVFVSAGAGTGKTTVLVERVALAIEAGAAPDSILVVTFTERAAQQLLGRVRSRLEAAAEALAELADRCEISTIHGFCARLLRQHAFAAGLDPDFRVLDEASASILAAEAFDRALREAVDEDRDETLDLLVAYGGGRLRGMLAAVHSRLRSAGLPLAPPAPTPPDLDAARDAARAACALVDAHYGDDDRVTARENRERARLLAALCDPRQDPAALVDLSSARLKRLPDALQPYHDARERLQDAALETVAALQHRRLVSLLGRFERAYRALKDAEGALDFEDLELRARDLLRDVDEVREDVHDRYRQVLVDEFQDTNRLQCELIDLVAAPEAERFYVGDEFQSIYRFRHADVAVFTERRERAPAHVALRDNYRSRPEVLAVVNDLFGSVFGDGYRALAASGRFEGAAFDYPVELLVVDKQDAGCAQRWRRAEADLVAERVRAVVEDGEHGPGDVVVLLRSATDVGVYEEALQAVGLDTHRAIGRGYYGRQQVLDLTAYLRLLRNRYDDRALLTVLASPLVGLSNDALLRVRQAARASLFHGIERSLPPGLVERDLNLLRAFRQRFDRLVGAMGTCGLEELCERIVQEHDYDLACLAQPDGRRRYANVRKLVRLAREYETLRGPDLPGFLAFVEAQASAAARESEAATAEEEGSEAVRLMTVHAAKGLEFPVVVVADCGRASPNARDEIIALPDGRFGFRVPDATGVLCDPPAYREVLAHERAANADEQQRVIYVAMTRAVDRLLVSGAWSPGTDDSPLGWMLDGLGLDPGAMDPAEPHACELAGGGRLLVHVRRPGAVADAAEAAPAEPVREQLTLFGSADASDAAPAAERQPVAALPALAPLPDAPLHVPRRLSFSAVALHERCQYRYYAERVLGLRPVERSALPAEGDDPSRLQAIEIGDAVHLLLEGDRALDVAARYPTLGDEDRALIDAFVARFGESPLATRLRGAASVRRELPFAFLEDGVVFRGRLDVLAREADGAVLIVDYKTTALEARPPAEVVAADYRLQLVVYALAALRGGAAAAEVAFAFLERADAVHAERFGPADEPALAAELRAAIDRLRASTFRPRPSQRTCADCGALDRICAGPRLAVGEG